MCHFLLLPFPHLCSGEGKKLRKYILSFKLKQSFILMIEEKAFTDFIITWVLIFSFGSFYLYKMCMLRKLHKNIQIPLLTLGFHFFGKYGCTHAMFEIRINDPDIHYFLIAIHDQCAPLDFEYPLTY